MENVFDSSKGGGETVLLNDASGVMRSEGERGEETDVVLFDGDSGITG